MTTARPRFRTKAEWAAHTAAELKRTAGEVRQRPSFGSYTRAARKGQAATALERRAARLEALARSLEPPEPHPEWMPF